MSEFDASVLKKSTRGRLAKDQVTQILSLLDEGYTAKSVADAFGVSPAAVTYQKNAAAKRAAKVDAPADLVEG